MCVNVGEESKDNTQDNRELQVRNAEILLGFCLQKSWVNQSCFYCLKITWFNGNIGTRWNFRFYCKYILFLENTVGCNCWWCLFGLFLLFLITPTYINYKLVQFLQIYANPPTLHPNNPDPLQEVLSLLDTDQLPSNFSSTHKESPHNSQSAMNKSAFGAELERLLADCQPISMEHSMESANGTTWAEFTTGSSLCSTGCTSMRMVMSTSCTENMQVNIFFSVWDILCENYQKGSFFGKIYWTYSSFSSVFISPRDFHWSWLTRTVLYIFNQ